MKIIEGLLWRWGYVRKDEAEKNQTREVLLRQSSDNPIGYLVEQLGTQSEVLGLLRDDVKRLEAERDASAEELKNERADRLIKTHNQALRKAKPAKTTRRKVA